MSKFLEGSCNNDIIELRLPVKSEYLPILRATTGVVAGAIPFNYDEIMQLRVAVTEVFDLAIKHVKAESVVSQVNELAVHFWIHDDEIEILIASPGDYTSYINREEGRENLALLRSLMDEVEFSAEVAGKTVAHIVKHRSSTGGI